MKFLPPDNLIQQPVRFAIMAYLMRADDGVASFPDVLRAIKQNPGGLATHGALLEQAGYIKYRKTFKDRRPHTVLMLTTKGRAAFAEHKAKLDAMSAPAKMVEASA